LLEEILTPVTNNRKTKSQGITPIDTNVLIFEEDDDDKVFSPKNNPLIAEGPIYRKVTRGSLKRWAQVDDSFLYVFKSKLKTNSEAEKSKCRVYNLLLSSVKIIDGLQPLQFEVITKDGLHHVFRGETDNDTTCWAKILSDIVRKLMENVINGDDNTNNQETINKIAELEKLLSFPENDNCADCKCDEPEWVSLTFGIFLCLDCSGIHRSLGTHISFVKSVFLDKWEDEQIELLRNVGNYIANQFWEKDLQQSKPSCDDSIDEKKEYVINKYLKKQYTGDVTNEQIAKMIFSNNTNLDFFSYDSYIDLENKRKTFSLDDLPQDSIKNSNQTKEQTKEQIKENKEEAKEENVVKTYIEDQELLRDAILMLVEEDAHFRRQLHHLLFDIEKESKDNK